MDKYTSQLLKLQPPGRALPSHQSSNWVRLLAGIAQEFSRIDVRLDDFTEAFLLQSGEELLSDWERVLGLPEQCLKSENITDIAIRRARVKAKLADNGPQDKAYFIKLAADLGITATVIEFKPFFMGSGQMGDALGGYENVLAWQMDFQTPISAAHFAMVKCLVRHNKPAETHVIFSIDGIPEDITAGYNYHEMRVETWAGELETLPADRLVLDGSLLDRKFYPSLFRWLGHQYAAPGDDLEGDTFRLPDLRGYTLLGTTSDEEVGQFQEDKVMWHEHTVQTLVSGAWPNNKAIAGGGNNRTSLSLPQGTETRMKNISVYFILKIRPFFYQNTIGEIAFNPSFKDPKKALVCDGSEVSRVEYASLYAVIGDTYGAGDGENTFNLPDINDVYIRATALGSVVDSGRASRLNRGDGATGDVVGTRQLSQIKSHAHMILDYANQGTSVGWIRGFGTRVQIGTPLVSAAAPMGGKDRDNINVQTPSDIPWDVYAQAPGLYINNPFVIKDVFDDKNHMRAIKMKAVIFYDA